MAVDPPTVQLLTMKRAEDGNGLIARLWNPNAESVTAHLALPHAQICEVRICNLAEEDGSEALPAEEHSVQVSIPAAAVITVRLAFGAETGG